MYKFLRQLCCIIIVGIICSIIVLPLLSGSKQANAGPPGSTPWCDMYGFIYTMDGLNCWSQKYHWTEVCSDIYEAWNPNDPSAHWSRCNHPPPWPGSAYYNATYSKPYNYLNTNAMFVFHGHASQWRLCFEPLQYNPERDVYFSYITSDRAYKKLDKYGVEIPQLYITDSRWALDYMAFAYLGGCNTAEPGTDHIVGKWRCYKGTDSVFGFKYTVQNKKHAEFIENFFKNAIIGNGQWAINLSALFAAYSVRDVFGEYGGVYDYSIWGSTTQKIDVPHWGIKEL